MTRPQFNLFSLLLVVSSVFLFLACSGDETNITDGDTDSENITDGDTDNEDITDGDTEIETDEEIIPTAFRLGYGEIDITPFEDFDRVLIGSYGTPGLSRAMKGVHDPLMAQAILIENDAGQSMMIIALDLCGYLFEFDQAGPGIRELRENIVKELQGKVNIKPENIIAASSHNHTSTDLYGNSQDYGSTVPRDLLEWHVDKITQAAIQASKNMQDVSLYFAETELEGYSGRDQQPLNSGNYCSEIIDNSVMVMQAKDKDDKTVVTLANYAKHPTQIDWTILEASADFIYGYREELKKKVGGNVMFLQGFDAAVHDGPKYAELEGEPESYEKAYNMGAVLAETVYNSFADLKKANEFSIEHKEDIIKIQSAGFYYDMDTIMKVHMRSFEETDGNYYILKYVPVSWHKIGPAQFVAWPGEPSPEYSLKLKARMQSEYSFMVGLANDQIAYIVDPESVENDPTGKLAANEIKYGPGILAGPQIMEAMENMNVLLPEE